MRLVSRGGARAQRNPKMQFSKKMCVKSWYLMAISVIVCLGGEFFLQFTGKGSMSEIVAVVLSLITFFTVFINGGYITQNIFRDTSLNKHGIHVHQDDGIKYYMSRHDDVGDDDAEG
jgi:drug/metabolite transporter (DMT)-like permease